MSFRAGRFEQAAHYYRLEEAFERRHADDEDLEDHERRAARERLDEAGWITGDRPRFERHVRTTIRWFGERPSIDGLINTYVEWALLGRRVDSEKVPSLEEAAAEQRHAMEEFAKPPALDVTQILVVDDGLARANFWLGEYEKVVPACDRYLAALDAWKELPSKPRHVQLGRPGPTRNLVNALRILARGKEEEVRSPTASRLLLKYLLANREEPAGHLFEFVLLFPIAVAWADPNHALVADFLETFPHLDHLLRRRKPGPVNFPAVNTSPTLNRRGTVELLVEQREFGP